MALSKTVLLTLCCMMPLSALAETDPTAPLTEKRAVVVTKKGFSLPRLGAIFCDRGRQCSAVFNGRDFEQGQQINGFYISKINENNVILKRGGQSWSLAVFKEQVTQ